MEDEHQSTLKKKIQILFQLGKWPDVVKLCDSYGEQYGKDMEIDMIRFKSMRHMGVPAPAVKPEPEEDKAGAKSEPPPAAKGAAAEKAFNPVISTIASDELSPDTEFQGGFEPEAPEEIVIGDPFADDDQANADLFAEDGPGFSLAPEQHPVDMSGIGAEEGTAAAGESALEMEKPPEVVPAPEAKEEEVNFSAFGAMTIDADPELIPSRPRPEPAETIFPAKESKTQEDSSRSVSGRVDVVEEREEPKPAAAVAWSEPEEISRRPTLPFQDEDEKRPTLARILTPKRVLLVVLPLLVAGALWLALSGRLGFLGGKKNDAAPQPSARPPAARRVRPAIKPAPPVTTPDVGEQEKAYAEKFHQAEELFKKKEMLKAWAVLLEAKKIKVTEPLRQLEEQLSKEIRAAEERAKKETEVEANQWQMENDAFTKAETANTLAGWKEFLKAYPNGELALRAGKKVAQLEKKAEGDAQQQLLMKIQQAQQIRLRSSYLSMSQADIAAMVRQGGMPPARFEAHEHAGATVLLDYSTGLMWNLWNKPMAYDKAKWWANRIVAGYGGWRLPTAEEALSLLRADRGQYSGLAEFAVWTADTVSDQPRTVWVLKIPEGQFLGKKYDQSNFVWAVRKAGK